MVPTKACNHPQTFEVLKVLDAHLTWTDALLECTVCAQYYLAELIDLDNHCRVYRLATLASDATVATLNSLAKGSCDLQRAAQEIAYLASLGESIERVLLITGDHALSLIKPPAHLEIPRLSWRDLPCDGNWLRELGNPDLEN